MSEALNHTLDARGVATVTLNRPELHNAFDDALIAHLTSVLETYGANPTVRALVLTGAGKSFSAGADLGWMKRMAGYSYEENLADAAGLARLMQVLDRLPKPVIGLINGAAYGGGVGLVACCDIAIAADRASFCLSEVKLGLLPAAISPYVVAAIGQRQARRYFQTAEVISAEEARRIGLVHEVVPLHELEAARDKVLAAIFLGAPGAQADAKDLVFTVDRPLTGEVIAETGRRIALRRASDEGREGVGAFLAKRDPAWRRSE
ncbi:enoyl-CoA hydratase/isomerase family protein [Aliidongia dinghuensis]|nr:enoyl-CoA hydratase/isomerase family protein [Aliidongia dinghuensis]